MRCIVILLLLCGAITIPAETPPPPADFTRFEIPGHEEEAQLLNDYLWYHFTNRGGNGLVLFNLEYLNVSDLWLGGALDKASGKPIQQVHREQLLGARVDPDGYVETHQHFSHALDQGWPFPTWAQGDQHQLLKGKTFGWHFQPLDQVPHWTGDMLRAWKAPEWCGEAAAAAFTLENLRSDGLADKRWHLSATGDSPALLTPAGCGCDAFQAPFVQLRWKRSGSPPPGVQPYIEWMRDGDTAFSPERRVYLYFDRTTLSNEYFHSIAVMHTHPLWRGKITQLRVALAPGENDVQFEIDSLFTAYDTRHTINNPIFILSSAWYFHWTQDLDFLRENIVRMRAALRYQQTEMGGLEHKHIRNAWVGHNGLPGFQDDAKGNRTILGGNGIGSNYWDLLPFGWDDLYATNQYYAATIAMASIEEAIAAHPGWNMPGGGTTMDPAALRAHAAEVKAHANNFFWNETTGRFIACVDQQGNRHDYGFTFVNLDAIWYGLADDNRAHSVMDWISGARTVAGDTSTGADIYFWRFGPRATTLRNVEWYTFPWTRPEHIAWGGQVQDGGAVLGFTFYDLMARLKVYGPDNAWERLCAILAWEKDAKAAGGYRNYYLNGKPAPANAPALAADRLQGTLQGGGTAGGLGIDHEFYESSLLPAFLVYGLCGATPNADGGIDWHPQFPAGVDEIRLHNIELSGTTQDLTLKRP